MPGQSMTSPFKPTQTVFEQEAQQAVEELGRPAGGLLLSGLLAGFGVGASILVLAALLQVMEGQHVVLEPLVIGLAYGVGFVLVIAARTDLFTEYTTIAILPVLMGKAGLGRLLRLWSLVYLGNLAGAAGFAALMASLAPRLGIADQSILSGLAESLVHHPWWTVLASASLAGWLMGFLSWLVTAGRETISQIVFIWLIAAIIGIGHLHHSVVGAGEVLTGMLSGSAIDAGEALHFLWWTTLGNVIGGVVFAVAIRYSILLSGESGSGLRGGRDRSD